MPLPVAHAAAGVSIVLLTMGPNVTRRALPWLVAGGALAGVLPDLDGLFPDMVQRGSHSLFLAVTLWSFAVLIGQRYASRLPEALAMALISHTVLDFLCTQFGKGAALLWPITSTRYRLGWMGLPENLTWYSWSNYWEWISQELLLFLLPAIWLVLWRWKQGAVLDNKKGLDPEENTNN